MVFVIYQSCISCSRVEWQLNANGSLCVHAIYCGEFGMKMAPHTLSHSFGRWTWIYANLFPLIFLLIHLMYACHYFLYLFVVCYANLTLTDLEFDLFVYSCVLRMEMHFQHWSNWQHFPSPWDVDIFLSQRWLFLESNIIYMKSKLDDHCGCWQSLEKFCWHRLCMFILHTLLCIMWTKRNEQRLLNAYSGRGSMKMSS